MSKPIFTGYRSLLLLVPFLLALLVALPCRGADTLQENFSNPPQTAGVRCFWWWLNSNVTEEAITSDLQAMKDKGFSGALIFDAGGDTQTGNSPVPPGPTFATGQWRRLFKHAVSEADRLSLELSLSIQSGWNLGGPNVTAQMAAKTLTWSQIEIQGLSSDEIKLPDPPARLGFYREIAVLACPLQEMPTNRENISPEPAQISDLQSKAAFHAVGCSAPDCRFLLNDAEPVDGEQYQYIKDVIDITDNVSPDGTLRWPVPAGRWMIFRFGYTPGGAEVSTSSADWKGLVLDYMDSSALEQYWRQTVLPLIKDAGPLAGKTLKYVHTDSWECGGANWTKNFRQEFSTRRGYDPVKYLPVIAGKIVESRQISNCFLADFRKTISDCVAQNHYQYLASLANQHNMGIHPESGGPHAGPFDAMKNLGCNDIVMGEYWVPSPFFKTPLERFHVKQSASVAHTYGKKLIAAEAFTSIGPHWTDVFWKTQKPTFDHEVCAGLNLNFLHTFTCSPKEMGIPGQEYFAGTHFNPNCTWWQYADGFLSYLHRCQYILQQGKFVADVLYYYGDHIPNLVQYKGADPAKVLPGYDYDVTNEDILLQTEVVDGHVVVPGGISYRLLVLPDHKVLSLAALRKVHALVSTGATVIGDKPQRLVSLSGYPQSHEQFAKIAGELWGDNQAAAGEKNFGQGRIIWGKNARDILAGEGIVPDCEVSAENDTFDYIHYKIQDADVYFLSNQKEQQADVVCQFRITGKQPELWDPLTGQIRNAKAFEQTDKKTKVPLRFDPYGSFFVVFRMPISKTMQGKSDTNFPEYQVLTQLDGPWQVDFDKRWGGPGRVEFEKLCSWTSRSEPGIRFYSGKATYKTTFDVPEINPRQRYVLDLGDVLDTGIAHVQLNGKDVGIAWTKPFRLDITTAIKVGSNSLEVDIVNSWRNRLIGDRALAAESRYTKTNIKIRDDWQLLDSGLLGPVKIITTDGL
jgi:hypothetical protein